jgi:diguanylate cyclase (GGDEF)-like protein
LAGKVSGTSRKRATRARAKPQGGARDQAARGAKAKADIPKSASAATRLAREVDALRAELEAARARAAELESRVDEDPLTGLLNRRGFSRALARALAFVRRYGTGAALLYLDLDRFKPINDRYGHAAGDWVLGRVARLIAGNVRASDVVGRIGGDEFVVLLWNIGADQAEDKGRALELLIERERFERSGRRFAVGLSAGVTDLSKDDTVDAALARADQAMYARKRERKVSA